MKVPANPPMERSEVTVKGETMSVISGAFVTSGVSYCNRMRETRCSPRTPATYHDKFGKVFSVSDHNLLSGQSNI